MFKRKESGSSQDLEHELIHVKTIKLTHSPDTASDDDQDTASEPSSVQHTTTAASFIYGNYPSYYGYRLGGHGKADPRLDILRKLQAQAIVDWKGKKILDIGCNAGDMTIEIGRQLEPEMILGIDIDPSLIKKARHHLQFQYSLMKPSQINRLAPPLKELDEHVPNERKSDPSRLTDELSSAAAYFPKCFPIVVGPIPMVDSMPMKTKPLGPSSSTQQICSTPFPFNVYFKCKNWIDEKETTVPHSVDVILCLSVTKWIHFNWGDAGIIRLFTRAYQELRPGGVFILESQPFSSYAKKKHVSHVPHGQIALKPESFTAYLLDTIGFQSHQTIESGSSDSHTVSVQGFNRPIDLFFK